MLNGMDGGISPATHCILPLCTYGYWDIWTMATSDWMQILFSWQFSIRLLWFSDQMMYRKVPTGPPTDRILDASSRSCSKFAQCMVSFSLHIYITLARTLCQWENKKSIDVLHWSKRITLTIIGVCTGHLYGIFIRLLTMEGCFSCSKS